MIKELPIDILKEIAAFGIVDGYKAVDETSTDTDDHGTFAREVIFQEISTGLYWSWNYEYHPRSGIKHYDGGTCYQVHQVDRIIKVWEVIKE